MPVVVTGVSDLNELADEIADPEARAQAWAERCGQAEVRAEAAERALHALLAELGHPTADTRRVPIQRADHDAVLSDIANMLGRTIALLEHISGKSATTAEDRTSVKIETGAKRELKAVVHVYAGDTDTAANTWLVEETIRLHALTQAYCDEGSAS